MRALPLVLAAFPSLALAEVIPLNSQISDVVIYPSGAKVTRTVPFGAPGGMHTLQLIDLPQGTPMDSVRVRVDGATMGAIKMREDFVPPRENADTPAITAARDRVEQLENAIAEKSDEARLLRLAKEAADTRIGFLQQLGKGDALNGASTDTLRDVSRMIGEETLAARRSALEAEAKARQVDRDREKLNDDLVKARQALAALVPEEEERNLIEVEVSAPSTITGEVTITYNHWAAGWEPVYDVHLASGETPRLTLDRGALIRQATGENWTGVGVTLSTNRPSGQTAPGDLWPDLRRIADPTMLQAMARKSVVVADAMQEEDMGMMAEPMIEAPVMATAAQIAEFSITYRYPDKIDLASDADESRVPLGRVNFSPELVAHAVPRRDETAFLVAEFSNESGEMLLPSNKSQFFLDGEYIGSRPTPHVAAGAKEHLSFGPIDGLRLTRTVDRNEGDRGVLTRSNEKTENARLSVENLTGKAWPVRLFDQVPYSEQEDLKITWTARPRATEQDVDGKKGILAWDFTVQPGDTGTIALSHKLLWPEGQVLE